MTRLSGYHVSSQSRNVLSGYHEKNRGRRVGRLLAGLILYSLLTGCAARLQAERGESQSDLAPPMAPSVHSGNRDVDPVNKLSKSSWDEGHSDEYKLAVERLLLFAPSAPPFEIEIWTDKETYHVGDTVTFFVRSDQDTHLTLVDVGTGGEMKIVFPNAFHEDGYIKAGRVYSIPAPDETFNVLVEGPPGVERIKAIATPGPLSVLDAGLARDFSENSENDREKVENLLRVLRTLDGSRWTEGQTDFLVIEKGARVPSQERPREMKPKKPEKPIDITGTPGLKPPEKLDIDKRPMHPLPSPEIGATEKKD